MAKYRKAHGVAECDQCGEQFTKRYTWRDQKYCSHKCAQIASRVQRLCVFCAKEIAHELGSKRKTCGEECRLGLSIAQARAQRVPKQPETTDQRAARLKEQRDRQRRRYAENADYRESQKAKRRRNKGTTADKARWAVYQAVQRGRLVRPKACSKCGGCGARIEAHHEDYSKPLQVQWLCSGCHALVHAKP